MASNGAAARADSGSGLWGAAEEGIVLGRAGTTLLLEWVPGNSWVPRYVSCPYTLIEQGFVEKGMETSDATSYMHMGSLAKGIGSA